MSKILITGSTGLVGTALTAYLREHKHDVVRLVRPGSRAVSQDEKTIVWDPSLDMVDSRLFTGVEVVINLAGATIAGRWTAQYKRKIYESRVHTTRILVQALSALPMPPKLFLGASAVGVYGNHAAGVDVTEFTPPSDSFLAGVCSDWEAAAKPLEAAGTRVVNLRLGVVLSRKGGALAKMLTPFTLGLGGPVGNGRQVMSWIALDEIPPLVEHIMEHKDIRGPVNAVAPNPVTNAQFTRALAGVIRRPAFFPLPGFVVKTLLGEMGEELLLGGARILPARLTQSGYTFRYPDIRSALEQAVHE